MSSGYTNFGDLAFDRIFAFGPNGAEIPVINSLGIIVASVVGGMTSVAQYGAVGDGTTDDTAAIQAAIDSGRSLFFPEGTYKITSQLLWKDASNIAWVGAGIGATTINVAFGGSPSTTPAIKIISATSLSNAAISNMTIKGSANSDSAAYELIQVNDNVSQVYFRDLELYYARHAGIRFTQSSIQNTAIISNCYFHDINSSAMTGINGSAILGLLNRSNVIGCNFQNCGNANGFHAVYVSSNLNDITITGNMFYGTHTDIHLNGSAVTNVAIVGNTVKNSGIVLAAGAGVVVSGNSLYESALTAQTSDSLISGNSFYFATASSSSFISAGGAVDRVTIKNNLFSDQSGHTTNTGITIVSAYSAASAWDISSNTFYGLHRATNLYGTGFIIKNNRITTTSTAEQIWLRSGSNHYVEQNYVSGGAAVRAIWNDSSTTIAIRENTITGTGTKGGSSSFTITGLASSSSFGILSTGAQSIAGLKTFITPLAGSSVTSASSSASGVVTTGSQSFAGSKTFTTALAGSNVVSASSSASGVVTTGTQSFAGTKTFVIPLTGSNVAPASSAASGVVTTGAQSFAGAKTFTTALAGSNIVSASTSASGVVTTSAQSFGGVKTIASGIVMSSAGSGGTASTLSKYETGSFNLKFTQNAAAGGNSATFSVKYAVIGNIVTLMFPNMNTITTGGGASVSISSSSGALVARLRPANATYHAFLNNISGAQVAQPGYISISTSGTIDVYRDFVTNWPTSNANNGPQAFSMSYTTA